MRPYEPAYPTRLSRRFLSVALFVSCTTAPLVAVPPTNPTAGSVKAMLPDASRNAHPLAVNDPLQWNDVLQTDAKGRVRAVLNDGSILSVGSKSQLKIVQHDAGAQQTVIDLDYGKLRNQVTKITQPQGKYQVKTSNAVIGVIGTDFFVDYAKGRTTIICYEGRVSVTPVDNSKVLGSTHVPVASDGSVTLHSGQIVIFGPTIASAETLLYPVLMEAGLKDTEVTAPVTQGSNVSAGSRSGTRASQDRPSSKNPDDNPHAAGAPISDAANSTAEQLSQSSKDATDSSHAAKAPISDAANSTAEQLSQSSKDATDSSHAARTSIGGAENPTTEQLSQSSKDTTDNPHAARASIGGAGNSTAEQLSQSSKDTTDSSHAARASIGGAGSSTAEQLSQGSKDTTDNPHAARAPISVTGNSTTEQLSQSSKNAADSSHLARASIGGEGNSTAEQLSQSSKAITGNSRISQPNPAPGSANELVSSNDKSQTRDEAQLVQLINQTRADKGLPPLNVDPRLTEAARKHTLLMVENGTLSHQFPGEPVLQERFDAVKLPSDYAAENVAWDTSVIAAHQALIGDAPHLRNILSTQASVVGIAVVRSGDHVFVTEDFAHIMAPDVTSQ